MSLELLTIERIECVYLDLNIKITPDIPILNNVDLEHLIQIDHENMTRVSQEYSKLKKGI